MAELPGHGRGPDAAAKAAWADAQRLSVELLALREQPFYRSCRSWKVLSFYGARDEYNLDRSVRVRVACELPYNHQGPHRHRAETSYDNCRPRDTRVKRADITWWSEPAP